LYGEVYKADCDQLPCAAKILHNHPDRDTIDIINNFETERALLSSIRHPYIVQFLDITLDPETEHPVLLMELLDESLTALLERSQLQPLAYHVQVDISHDMALAISYLHSKNIIHRDLSSNNVLIIAGRRAKVTDFCMFGIDVSNTDNHVPVMTSININPIWITCHQKH
jgi:serine/threonine-protein kinase